MNHPPLRRATSAFSLIEVTLAIGIIAFALTAVVGLLPVGLTSFRQAVDVSTENRIVQRFAAEARQTEFATLVGTGSTEYPVRHFDDQGTEVSRGADGIYSAKLVATAPANLPGGTTTDLARLVIDIVRNPGNKTLGRDPATGGIKDNPAEGLSVSRHSTLITRRQ